MTLKLDRRQLLLLRSHAEIRGCSQAAVVRELIDRHLGRPERPSLHDRSRDLCGTLRGTRGLSTRTLTGYGRD